MFNRYAVITVIILLCSKVQAEDLTPSKITDYASSSTQMVGDIVNIKSDMYGFQVVNATDAVKENKYCALFDSDLRINGRNNTYTFVELREPKKLFGFSKDDRKNKPVKGLVCPENAEMLTTGVAYRIANELFDSVHKKTSGVAFGALIVPFKFRLGHENKLISSSTIAPYLGYRFKFLQAASMQAVPVVAVGLGIVPVFNPTTNETDTKTGLSAAVGFIVTSEKSQNFSAGFVLGKDFVGRSDRILDPNVNMPWISLWLGVAVK